MTDRMATWNRASEMLNEAEPTGEDVAEWIAYLERKIEAAQCLLKLADDADAVADLDCLIREAQEGIDRLREVEDSE